MIQYWNHDATNIDARGHALAFLNICQYPVLFDCQSGQIFTNMKSWLNKQNILNNVRAIHIFPFKNNIRLKQKIISAASIQIRSNNIMIMYEGYKQYYCNKFAYDWLAASGGSDSVRRVQLFYVLLTSINREDIIGCVLSNDEYKKAENISKHIKSMDWRLNTIIDEFDQWYKTWTRIYYIKNNTGHMVWQLDRYYKTYISQLLNHINSAMDINTSGYVMERNLYTKIHDIWRDKLIRTAKSNAHTVDLEYRSMRIRECNSHNCAK